MNKKTQYLNIALIIVIYGTSLLLAGYWSPSPRLVGLVGFFLGVTTFYLVYSSRLDSKYLDVILFVVTLMGSFVGTLLLYLSCSIIYKPVCTNSLFRAQTFGNFVFPLIFVIVLWVTRRLPVILRKNR